MHHTFFILGFFKGKLAKNEPKLRDFQNLPKTRPKMIFMGNKCLFQPFFGIVSDKKWCLFSDLGVQSPIFWHPKTANFSDFGPKKGLLTPVLTKLPTTN